MWSCRAAEAAREMDRKYNVRVKFRHAQTDFQRMLPHWKRRFRQFASSPVGKTTFTLLLLWAIVSGTLFRVRQFLLRHHILLNMRSMHASICWICSDGSRFLLASSGVEFSCDSAVSCDKLAQYTNADLVFCKSWSSKITRLLGPITWVQICMVQAVQIFLLLWWILPLLLIPLVRKNAAKYQENMYGAASPRSSRGFGNAQRPQSGQFRSPGGFSRQRRQRPKSQEGQVIDVEWTTIDSDTDKGQKRQ